jgi:RpiR family transcriptional regulator, carbohydrate utilization regulator
LTEKDVAVLISHSGTTKDTLDVMEVAKENGATTIGITNFAKSPLSQNVDIAFFTVSEETDYRTEAFASRIAQLRVIDTLYVNVMIARKEEGVYSLQKMRNAISVKNCKDA